MESNESKNVLVAFNIASGINANSTDIDSVTDKIVICKTFFTDKLVGSFFSCIYNGKLRIHLIFNEETDLFNSESCELIRHSMEITGNNSGTIWFRKANQSLIEYVKSKFELALTSEEFYYHSTEYIMCKGNFGKKFDCAALEVKPYEETHIDKYLSLLNDAMSFFVPPKDFVAEKAHYLQEFFSYKNKNAFEAFWKDGKLVGLYWLDGKEVDTMCVSSDFQRRGYGSMILTRAIETIFQQHPEAEKALLYCVGWNAKAQNFYKRYGMEMSNQYKVPYNIVNPTE